MNELMTLDQLAVEIRFYSQNSAQNALEIGKRLILAKKQIPHGEWGEWLKEKVDYTQNAANRFMKCAERFANCATSHNLGGENVNCATSHNLSISQMIELLTLPEDETQDFIAAKAAEGKPVEDMTVKELRAEVADWKGRVEDAEATIADLRHENRELRQREPLPDAAREIAEQLKVSEAARLLAEKEAEDLRARLVVAQQDDTSDAEIKALRVEIEKLKDDKSDAELARDDALSQKDVEHQLVLSAENKLLVKEAERREAVERYQALEMENDELKRKLGAPTAANDLDVLAEVLAGFCNNLPAAINYYLTHIREGEEAIEQLGDCAAKLDGARARLENALAEEKAKAMAMFAA